MTQTEIRDLPTPAGFLERAAAAGLVIESPLVSGSLVVDLDTYTVTLDGMALDLSPRQLELLAVFLAAPGRVWSRDQLHRLCWGDVSPRVGSTCSCAGSAPRPAARSSATSATGAGRCTARAEPYRDRLPTPGGRGRGDGRPQGGLSGSCCRWSALSFAHVFEGFAGARRDRAQRLYSSLMCSTDSRDLAALLGVLPAVDVTRFGVEELKAVGRAAARLGGAGRGAARGRGRGAVGPDRGDGPGRGRVGAGRVVGPQRDGVDPRRRPDGGGDRDRVAGAAAVGRRGAGRGGPAGPGGGAGPGPAPRVGSGAGAADQVDAALGLADQTLVRAAVEQEPAGLRVTLRGWLADHTPEVLEQDARDAHRRRRLTLSGLLDGSHRVTGSLPGPDAEALHTALAAYAGKTGADDPRTLGQRQADALVELARRAIAPGCPQTAGLPTRVTLIAPVEALTRDRARVVPTVPVMGRCRWGAGCSPACSLPSSSAKRPVTPTPPRSCSAKTARSSCSARPPAPSPTRYAAPSSPGTGTAAPAAAAGPPPAAKSTT